MPDAPDEREASDEADVSSPPLANELAQMRDEAQRIASLKTGDEKVTSAEVFTQAAGELDEAIARAARDDEQPDT